MKFSKDNPPNYEEIIKVLPDAGKKGVIFCYGDTVYGAEKIRKDLEIHEAVHSRQQGNDPKGWWNRYLKDITFRLDQELEAYAAQYIFIKTVLRGKLLKSALQSMAHDLSSEQYGNIITQNEAECKIRNYGKTN